MYAVSVVVKTSRKGIFGGEKINFKTITFLRSPYTMRNYGKKILGIVAAATMLGSIAVAAGCGKTEFKMEAPNAADYAGAVASNGGFAVEKGNYIYFINGVESNTADNTYGEVEKGALMRITKAQLAAGEYNKAVTVVPSLFVSKNYEAGIFIYGDYVYYATPTTDKNLEGKVENSYIDFKRAKLDGTEKPKIGRASCRERVCLSV